MTQPTEKSSPPTWEVVAIICLCFGWFILGSIMGLASGVQDGAFSDPNLLEMVLFELFFGYVALSLLRQRGHTLRELLPKPHWPGVAIGAALYVLVALGCWLATALVGTHYPEQPIDRMVATSHPSVLMVVLLSVVNGLYEEVFVLGYLVRAVGRHGGSFAVGVSTLIRLSYHVYQGPLGAMSVVIFSIVVGVYYWRTRDLWPAVFAHMAADIIGLLA